MKTLTLKYQKYEKQLLLRLFFFQFLKIMFLILCLKVFKLAEVFNVLFKLFQSERPT